jgi:hypothetical protein
MSTVNPALGRWLAGCGGVLLIASLFMPWSEVTGLTRTGWETVSVWDVFVLITGVCGIAAAVTGGQFGFFRRDLSFNGMTDIFGVVLVLLIAWLLLVDFPSGASREVGVYLALAGAAAVASGAGDFRVTSWFPRLPPSGEPTKLGAERRQLRRAGGAHQGDTRA